MVIDFNSVKFKFRKQNAKNIFFIALSQKKNKVIADHLVLFWLRSKPQAWYIITRSVYGIREAVWHHTPHEFTAA